MPDNTATSAPSASTTPAATDQNTQPTPAADPAITPPTTATPDTAANAAAIANNAAVLPVNQQSANTAPAVSSLPKISLPALSWKLVIGIVVATLIGGGGIGYLLAKPKETKTNTSLAAANKTASPSARITPRNTATPQPTATPEQTQTLEKKKLDNSQISFSYMSDWAIVADIPAQFRYNIMDYLSAKTKEDIIKSFGKMFAANCRGPILYNEKLKSVIAFEVITPNSDGAYCWSGGVFFEPEKRIISTLKPRREISVDKWKMNDFMFPIDSGEVIKVDWKGDWFESFAFSGRKNSVTVGLYTPDAYRRTAEKAFDDILATLLIK